MLNRFFVFFFFILLVLLTAGCSKNQTVMDPQPSTPGQARSIVGKSLNAGKSSECRSQLSQLRQAVQVYRVDNEQNPASLTELNLNMPAEFYRCPVTKQDYLYDPSTGNIKCANPDHSDY